MNATASYRFTIVVPLYDERENLPRLEERLAAYLAHSAAQPACVLLVDDGSTDGGSALIEAICARQAGFFFLRLQRNSGLSAALKAGFEACESPLVGQIPHTLHILRKKSLSSHKPTIFSYVSIPFTIGRGRRGDLDGVLFLRARQPGVVFPV